MPSRFAIGLLVLVLAIPVLACTAAFAEESFYIYQNGYLGMQGDVTLESETAYGTRDSRLYGSDAFEQGVAIKVSGTNWLSIRAEGSALFLTGESDEPEGLEEEEEDNTKFAFAGDLFFNILRQKGTRGLNFALGAGYQNDYEQTSIPRAHLALSREWDNFDLSFSTTIEVPLGGEEEEEGEVEEAEEEEEEEGEYDEIDGMISLASSYAFTDWFRLGLEGALEDIEGFWEEEEAEGGAKTIVGPTFCFNIIDNLVARANTGAVIPLTSNDQTRVPGEENNQSDVGFLGRMTIAYTF